MNTEPNSLLRRRLPSILGLALAAGLSDYGSCKDIAPRGPLRRAYGATTLEEERKSLLLRRLNHNIATGHDENIQSNIFSLLSVWFLKEHAFSRELMVQYLIDKEQIAPTRAAAVVASVKNDTKC